MREKLIRIEIKNGKVSFTVEGVKGEACLAETRFLEDALGGQVVQREHTSEYYEEPEADQVTTTQKS